MFLLLLLWLLLLDMREGLVLNIYEKCVCMCVREWVCAFVIDMYYKLGAFLYSIYAFRLLCRANNMPIS